MFSYFGLLKVIHSDNGSEFVNDIIAALVMLWPGKVSLINGAPGHSQSQGLAEQGNNSIENFISDREQEEHKCCWASLLPEIQCKRLTFLTANMCFKESCKKRHSNVITVKVKLREYEP